MKYLRSAALLMALLFLFCSCGGKGMEQGSWEADTFINKWAGLQFTLPAGSSSLGAAQMREWTQNDAAAYHDAVNKPDLKEAGLYYDCILLLAPGHSVQIFYENVEGLPELDAGAYAALLQQGFAGQTAAIYEYDGAEERELAGQIYACHSWEVNETVVQRAYLRRQEDAMICIFTSCPKKQTEQVAAFLEGLKDPNAKEEPEISSAITE